MAEEADRESTHKTLPLRLSLTPEIAIMVDRKEAPLERQERSDRLLVRQNGHTLRQDGSTHKHDSSGETQGKSSDKQVRSVDGCEDEPIDTTDEATSGEDNPTGKQEDAHAEKHAGHAKVPDRPTEKHEGHIDKIDSQTENHIRSPEESAQRPDGPARPRESQGAHMERLWGREAGGVEGGERLLEGGECRVERKDGPVTLRLLDAALWQAFRQEGTEMIITKAGRRMFPFVMVTLEGLSPTLLYSVQLSLVPCDNRQYKFCQRRWINVSDTSPGPTPIPDQSYTHPASPNRGSFWCQEAISFAKLKITNNKHSQGDVVLQSMRKYMAQVTVREDLGDTHYVFTLPETTFVAVTQYQNDAVTRMKIAHNPFANGFKYAHVTGSEDGKKLFSRSDLTRSQACKQRYSLSTGKSGGKTTRVKAMVTPQTLPSVILNPQLVTPALPLTPTPLHHLPASLAMKSELISESCLIPGNLDLFRCPSSLDDGQNRDSVDEDMRSPSPDRFSNQEGCSPLDGDNDREKDSSEEEDPDSVTGIASPNPALPVSISGIAACNNDVTPGRSSHRRDNCVHEQQVLTPSGSGPGWSPPQGPPSTATNLSLKGQPFKQPLPRKTGMSGQRGGRKSSGGEGGGCGDVDSSWFRAALRQSGERERNEAVKQDRGIQLRLHDSHIWHSFANCGSNMIAAQEGRTMFPVINVSLRGLDPGRLYSVWLHVTPAQSEVTQSQSRETLNPWASVFPGTATRPVPAPSVKPYMHPCSPMRGLAWMKGKVGFSEVTLTTLTSESTSSVGEDGGLIVQCGRQYLTQIVVREEEEVTPNGAGNMGDIFFFPLPEVTFNAKQDTDDSALALPLTSLNSVHSDTRKRSRESSNGIFEEDTDETDGSTNPLSKVTRIDVNQNHCVKLPASLPRSNDLSPLLSRPPDLSTLLPRSSDLCNRISPLYCFPQVPPLPPAHVGLLANRMPLPLSSPLQPMAPFPFHPQLFPHLRTPMHSAFSLALPPFNPFPYFYYPYSLPPLPLPSTSSAPETCKGLDLSVRADSR